MVSSLIPKLSPLRMGDPGNETTFWLLYIQFCDTGSYPPVSLLPPPACTAHAPTSSWPSLAGSERPRPIARETEISHRHAVAPLSFINKSIPLLLFCCQHKLLEKAPFQLLTANQKSISRVTCSQPEISHVTCIQSEIGHVTCIQSEISHVTAYSTFHEYHSCFFHAGLCPPKKTF